MSPEIRTLSVGALTRVEGEGALHVTRSALDAFASDITAHRHGRCEAALTSVHGTGHPRHHTSGSQ